MSEIDIFQGIDFQPLEPDEDLNYNKTQPHSERSERALLGGVLIDAEAYQDVQYLTPQHFYISKNRYIWETIQNLNRHHQPIDYLTVCTDLADTGHLQDVGGPAEVMSLINSTPSSLNVPAYAERLTQELAARLMLQCATALAQAAYDRKGDRREAVMAVMDRLAKINTNQRGAVHISQYLSRIYDDVDALIKHPRNLAGIDTDLPDYNASTGGLITRTTTLISGDPGTGKTILLMQLLVAAAKHGHGAALYELDVTGELPLYRQISGMSGITTWALRTGRIEGADIPMFTHAIDTLAQYDVYISEDTSLTTQDIRADLYRLKAHGVEVFGVDMTSQLNDDAPTENEFNRIVNKRLHDTAKDLNMHGLCIGDMTKAGIVGTVTGQGAVGGTAKSLHVHDNILRLRKDKDNELKLIGTWEKLRDPMGKQTIMEFIKKPNFPMFENQTKPPAKSGPRL